MRIATGHQMTGKSRPVIRIKPVENPIGLAGAPDQLEGVRGVFRLGQGEIQHLV